MSKVRENRLRRMAERQGLALVKSPRRDPLAAGYGRYALVERYDLTLDDVEENLTGVKRCECGRTNPGDCDVMHGGCMWPR